MANIRTTPTPAFAPTRVPAFDTPWHRGNPVVRVLLPTLCYPSTHATATSLHHCTCNSASESKAYTSTRCANSGQMSQYMCTDYSVGDQVESSFVSYSDLGLGSCVLFGAGGLETPPYSQNHARR